MVRDDMGALGIAQSIPVLCALLVVVAAPRVRHGCATGLVEGPLEESRSVTRHGVSMRSNDRHALKPFNHVSPSHLMALRNQHDKRPAKSRHLRWR